jgi:hypothetical protein
MFKKIFIVLTFLCPALIDCTRHSDFQKLSAPQTSQFMQEKLKNELIQSTILENLGCALSSENEKKWQSAFWAMELIQYQSEQAKQRIKQAFLKINERSISFQRALLEVICALYPNDFHEEVRILTEATENSKIFAMGIFYLNGCRLQPNQGHHLWLQEKFSTQKDDSILFMLNFYLAQSAQHLFPTTAQLIDLIKNPFFKHKCVIFSFQRVNRSYPGLTVIKKNDDKFLRKNDGTLFSISHLARSVSNLPGFLTNGNTPQGIYSIQGVENSDNAYIGPSPMLILALPGEISVNEFFHSSDQCDRVWSKTLYTEMLPENWQQYIPIYDAFFAGAAGRCEILAHGTTINPDFYLNQPYFPNTPSLGCLTALELWSPLDGKCLYSAQSALIQAFQAINCDDGYFVVVEIDDKHQPVAIEELLLLLLKAEGKM